MARQTVDLAAVQRALRLRFLLFRGASGGPTLAERLSGGLHRGSPPDNAAYPYGAFRVLNLRPYPIDAPYFTADVELLLFMRPRAEADALQEATDLAVEAGVGFTDRTAGIDRMEVRDADVLPAFSEPADPEVIASRTTFLIVLYPPETP